MLHHTRGIVPVQDADGAARTVSENRRRATVSRRNAVRTLAGCFGLGAGLLLPRLVMAAPTGAPVTAIDLALKGQNLLAGNDAEAAVAALERAVALDPKLDFAWGLLGRAALAAGDRARALSAFSAAVGLRPSDGYSRMMIDYILQLPPERAEGVIAEDGGTPDVAADPLRRQAEQERADRISGAQDDIRANAYRIRRVVLDPGHGGVDPGAVGPSGLREKDVTLDVARFAARELARTAPDLKVFLTRSSDRYLSLSGRTALANRFGADLFLSLHVNAAERAGAQGVETYWCSEAASSKEAARVARFENSVRSFDKDADSPVRFGVEEYLFRFERKRYWREGGEAAERLRGTLLAGLDNAGHPMNDRGAHTANFFVLRKARMPAVLLETGFITNPDEERFLASENGRTRMAQGVAHAVAALAGESA